MYSNDNDFFPFYCSLPFTALDSKHRALAMSLLDYLTWLDSEKVLARAFAHFSCLILKYFSSPSSTPTNLHSLYRQLSFTLHPKIWRTLGASPKMARIVVSRSSSLWANFRSSRMPHLHHHRYPSLLIEIRIWASEISWFFHEGLFARFCHLMSRYAQRERKKRKII